MVIRTEALCYQIGDAAFSGMLAFDGSWSSPRPAIMIAHGWMGQGEFESDRAVAIAEMGYVGFAIDMYGSGRRATGAKEAAALMAEVDGDRPLLQRRVAAALTTLKALKVVDPQRTAAIGYCFGGKCVLDLARSGADVQGVVSLHGVYDPPPFPNARIQAKLLICHGWEDPLCAPDAVTALAQELSLAKADWQLHAYGGTYHAFTSPAADAPSLGLAYSPSADRRSWNALKAFLAEIFE